MALVTIGLGLTYTALIFLWQWLVRLPRTQATGWISSTKLNTFIYTYHVPYIARYRYWTGMFLLARILIYFIMDVFDDPRVHLLGISLTSACLHGIKTLLGERVYRRKWIDCLDTVSILNILVLVS